MNSEPEPGLGTRVAAALAWTLKTAIRLLVFVVLILVLAVILQLGIQQIDRRFRLTNQRIDLLHSDVGQLMENDLTQARQDADARSAEASQERRQSSAEQNLARQDEILQAMSAQLETLISSSGTISESVVLWGTSLVTLQSDVNDNGSRLDALGGQVDGIQVRLVPVESRLSEVEELVAAPNDELAKLQRILPIFHLWELVARARLRLAEDNPGLALVDVERALVVSAALVADETGDEPFSVQAVQVRLGLARDSLPDDPEAAARDLETVWGQIDQFLALLILPESVLSELAPAPESEATPQPAETPTATTSPPATTTPAATATPSS